MKKAIAILMIVLMAVACLVGCGAKKSNALVVGTSPDFPPFEYLENGQVVGIEPEMLQLIATELGMELKIEQVDFESVLPGVQAGKYTIGMSGITITEERKKNVLFTDAYFNAAQVIVVVEGSPIAAKADLTGKSISVQTGTTAEDYCMSEGYDVKAFAANNDAELALVSGKVDAWVIDNAVAKQMVASYNESNSPKLVILDEHMTDEPYAFAFKLGNEELCGKVNDALKKLMADGTVEALFTKYGETYVAP